MYRFDKLQEFELSSGFNVNDTQFPFEFGNLRKITLELMTFSDAWIDSFIVKNQQLEHLSLNIKSKNQHFDENVLKMKKTLPNLRSIEFIGACALQLDTIVELLRYNDLIELMLSGLHSETYAALKHQTEIKKMGWQLMLFSKFFGARFERQAIGNFE